MALATIGAMIIRVCRGNSRNAVISNRRAVSEYAVDKSRRSIADLMDIRPDYANIKKDDEIISFSRRRRFQI